MLAFGVMAILAALATAQPARQPLAFKLPAPGFVGGTNDWLNTAGKVLKFEKGRVYVVEFWTFGCINCQRNLPSYARWQKRFAQQKVTIIGVHTPETAAEKKTENVIEQVKKLGITYPILLDQSTTNWHRWRQSIWPTVYLVDKQGQVRYQWQGELDWEHAGGEERMARCIEALLREPSPIP
jgi:thiol-disulfide isomerase/thioredoxin